MFIGLADDQTSLGGGIDHFTSSAAWGAAPEEKKTKNAMVRFLATPGNSSGGGTYLVRTRFETHQRGRELQASLGVKTVTKASA